jgi:glycosyltransferase involved in cell wall biosynthesis
MPKVSVIIPTYNRADFIEDAVESVLCQTYKDFEIIIVDDGSTDSTKDVLQKFYNKIRYIYKNNGGVASARNTGIKHAQGEYIAFLDSDDLWLPERLKFGVRALDADKNIGLFFSDCNRVFNGERASRTYFNDYKPYAGFVFRQLFMQCFIPTLTVILRKGCFKKAGMFNEELRSCEDYDMWLRISACFKIDHTKMPLAILRSHSKSKSRESFPGPILRKVLVKTRINYKNHIKEFSRAAKRRISMVSCSYGWHLMKNGSYGEAIAEALGALKEDIFNLHGYKLLFLCFFMKIRKKFGIFLI